MWGTCYYFMCCSWICKLQRSYTHRSILQNDQIEKKIHENVNWNNIQKLLSTQLVNSETQRQWYKCWWNSFVPVNSTLYFPSDDISDYPLAVITLLQNLKWRLKNREHFVLPTNFRLLIPVLHTPVDTYLFSFKMDFSIL